jgi:hypothetical protein
VPFQDARTQRMRAAAANLKEPPHAHSRYLAAQVLFDENDHRSSVAMVPLPASLTRHQVTDRQVAKTVHAP